MSVGGAAPCCHRGPSTTVAGTGLGIDINNVIRNVAVTDIDTEQRRSVLTDVVVVLHFQLVR